MLFLAYVDRIFACHALILMQSLLCLCASVPNFCVKYRFIVVSENYALYFMLTYHLLIISWDLKFFRKSLWRLFCFLMKKLDSSFLWNVYFYWCRYLIVCDNHLWYQTLIVKAFKESPGFCMLALETQL